MSLTSRPNWSTLYLFSLLIQVWVLFYVAVFPFFFKICPFLAISVQLHLVLLCISIFHYEENTMSSHKTPALHFFINTTTGLALLMPNFVFPCHAFTLSNCHKEENGPVFRITRTLSILDSLLHD